MISTLILGGNGQLGKTLSEEIKYSKRFSRKQLNLFEKKKIEFNIRKYKPKFVINCAAYHETTLCEKNPSKAFNVNSIPNYWLSLFSIKYKFKLIYFSTDYVFNGKTKNPYTEKDNPRPINIYGLSKYLSELIIQNYAYNYLIFRVSFLYSEYDCRAKKGKNFIEKFYNIAKTTGQISLSSSKISPTYVRNLARQVVKVMNKVNKKVIHASSNNSGSLFEIAKFILKNYQVKAKLKVNKSSIDIDLIKRPKFSVLKNEFLIKNNLNIMQNWQDSMMNYFTLKPKISNHDK